MNDFSEFVKEESLDEKIRRIVIEVLDTRKKPRKNRLWKGNAPTNDPVLVACMDKYPDPTHDGAVTAWNLYHRGGKGIFVYFKLSAVNPVAHKANYWIDYNTRDGHLVRHKDVGLLTENRPGLYNWTIKTILNYVTKNA